MGRYNSLDTGFDNPTTGIALYNRKDRSKIFAFLHENNCNTFMLTLHGNENHHNEIVQRDDAFAFLDKFSLLLMENNFTIVYNLMLNKYFVSDWEDIIGFLSNKKNYSCRLTIPLFVPTERLRSYQKYRANYDECKGLVDKVEYIGINSKDYERKIERGNERYIQRLVLGKWDYVEKNKNQPQWAFFHIRQDLDLFYGNAGLHTKYLGNIRNISVDELVEAISLQKANYDYSAYYDISLLPDIDIISEYVTEDNLVYPDVESCIYSWLDRYGVKPILIE